MEDLEKRILDYRAKHNLSMEEFANKCGITRATLYNLGKRKNYDLTIKKIKLVLGE